MEGFLERIQINNNKVYGFYVIFLQLLKMFSIIAPFVSEAIYLNLKEEFNLREKSISHYPWPKAEESRIDEKLEAEMQIAQNIIQATLNAREKVKLGLRWPVKEVIITTSRPETAAAVKRMKEILKSQLNAKEIKTLEKLPGLKIKLRPDAGKIGQTYTHLSAQILARLTIDSPESILIHINKENSHRLEIEGEEVKITKEMLIIEHEVPKDYQEAEFNQGYVYLNATRTPELEAEGYAREVMRNVQQLRKHAGFEKLDRINLQMKCSQEMQKQLTPLKLDIKEKVGAEKMELLVKTPTKALKHSDNFKIKQEQFEVWFEKVQ